MVPGRPGSWDELRIIRGPYKMVKRQVQKECRQAIQAYDKTLAMLRELWLEAPEKDKKKWMDQINVFLDERLTAMKEMQ